MNGIARTTDNTGRLGVNAVEAVFLNFAWIFREQAISDHGVDAQVEITKDGQATGKLIALQIKSGPSYFRPKGEGYIYYGEKRHLEYWTGHSLPVFLILVNTDTNEIVWKKIDINEIEVTDKGWSTVIPKKNILNLEAKSAFEESMTISERELQRLLDKVKEVDQGKTELLSAIEGISQADQEMRIRILGYSLWFAPLQKAELIEYLGRFHPAELIENNAQRLCQAGLLKDTGNNYLPNLSNDNSKLVCEQAMSYVREEIIEFVGSF